MIEINRNLFRIFPSIKELVEIFKELDSIIERFKKKTGIDCLKGCGKCCEIPSWKIETSIFELIPLAIHLWETKKAEIFIEKIIRTGKDDFCVFYKKSLNKNGCCYVYPFRPLICRLFGFSAIKDKYGQSVPILCPVIKKEEPEKLEMIKGMMREEDLEMPINSFYATRVKIIDPIYSKDLYPINEATKIAIEMVVFRLRLFENKENEFEPTLPYKRAA